MLNPNDFAHPPHEFLEIPFWSWNDELDPAELARQANLIKQAGWGGFFMHSRIGLKTPYMGKEWMQAVRTCVDEARRSGLDAWLYDEDKWPSGFAGGLSVASNPEHRAQYLVCKVDDRPALLQERLATFSARSQKGSLVDIRMNENPPFQDRFDRMIQFYVQTMPLSDPWFNGYAYLNLLNPQAVQEFLASTHAVYAREIGGEFGSVVPGVFTDEPCTFFRVSRSANPDCSVPWEKRLPEVFLRRRGYDLLPHLPALFFETEGAARVRYDFWRTVTEMFVEAFSQPYAEWCRRHHLVLTGHYMSEDTMLTQVQWGLAAAMPHYAWMDYPGVDKLGRQVGRLYGTVLTVKQLDSVGCQAGKKRLLVENFALSGQDFAHQGRKWLADWAAVLGANLHNLHLCLYSMRGERKRDCPPNLFFQQPWWPENRMIADYTARLSYALSQGKRVVDILVIHPIGSAWASYTPGGTAQVELLDDRLDHLLNLLLQNQRDFHLGDEMMMEPGGSLPAQVVVEAGIPRLQVGEMRYRVVIVPPCLTLNRCTVDLLEAFKRSGGVVLVVAPAPSLVDGQPAQAALFGAEIPVTQAGDLVESLDHYLEPALRISNRPTLWVHQRRLEDRGVHEDLFFLANTSLEEAGEARIELAGEGRVEEWDLVNGSVHPLPVKLDPGRTTFTLEFAPAGSHLLLFRKGATEEIDNHIPAPSRLEHRLILDGEWEISNQGLNSLVLDRAEYRWGSQLQGEDDRQAGQDSNRLDFNPADFNPADILSIQSALTAKGPGTAFALRYEFDIAEPPEGRLYLVMESPQEFEILVNGQVCSYEPGAGWWVDPAFSKVEIGHCVVPGRNSLLLKGKMGLETELEAVYLVGNFGVERKRKGMVRQHTGQWFDLYERAARITRPARQLVEKAGADRLNYDLTDQGFSNFAGRVTLVKSVTLPEEFLHQRSGVLRIDNLRAAVAHLCINHQEAGSLAWQPHRLDISQWLQPGQNLVELELVGTLRNLLGPLHLSCGEGDYTGPAEYRDARLWTDDQVLTPFGFDRIVLEFTH